MKIKLPNYSTILLILTFFVTCSVAYSQEKAYAEKIDDFIEKVNEMFPDVPALGVAIVKNDKPILVEGYGYADLKNKKEADKNTSFYIASTTKSFIGILATLLEYEGLLDLSAPLTNYKPFKTLSNKEVFEKTTIAELLNHTSGLTNNFITFRNSYLGNLSQKDAIMLLDNATKIGEKKFEYSNIGYNLLSILLKEEFGKDWRNLLDEKLFVPLQMNHTSAYISKATKEKWMLAKPYIAQEEKGPKEYSHKTDNTMHAAGGLISSASDAAKWLLYNINQGSVGEKQISASQVLEKAHKPSVKYIKEKGQIFQGYSYGMGWHNGTFKDKNKVIYHFGGYNGFQSHISFMPEEKIGIAIFTNEEHFGDNVGSIIASYAYEVLLDENPNEEIYEQKLDHLDGFQLKLVENFSKNKEKESYFEWRLTTSLQAFTGKFYNKYMGIIRIRKKDDALYIRFGELEAEAKVSPKINSMRVELIPNRPMTLSFKVDDTHHTIKEINSGGLTFKRIEIKEIQSQKN
ncbi:serine hydrolase domain-containing protein [uncultured Psychroserpens sp.]|uniref:serine hydrolase domain-containing protein n=1 Tax=uncultured Psychroserpens sp. TaxID=255436 RepID=UPI00261ACB99|nr:serine hydrolase domain-containing protein [uncultured Psychroserpens sp.]